MAKYPSEPKGRYNFDTALRDNTVDMIATEKTFGMSAPLTIPRDSSMPTTNVGT
jgi:hypothetical protein